MLGSTTNTAEYVGNGSTVTTYPIPFRYDAASWIVVTRTDPAGIITTLVQPTDYILSGTGSTGAGTFRTTVARGADNTLTVYREAPGLQTLGMPANAPLPAASLEATLDRVAMAAQDSVRRRPFALLSAAVTRLQAIIAAPTALAWSAITGKPSTFAPDIHTHDDRYFTEAETNALLDSAVTARAVLYDRAQPLTAPQQVQARANTNSAASVHTHAIADVSGLATDLAGKAPAVHTHLRADITDYVEKAPLIRTEPPLSTASVVSATGTITISAITMTPGQTVTIGGQIYTFRSTITGVQGDVYVNSPEFPVSLANTLQNAINAYVGSVVSATASDGVVTITAVTSGSAGNALTLAKTATGVNISGSTLTGGATAVTGTAAAYLGQDCIVAGTSVFKNTQLTPVKWAQTSN